MRETAYYKAAFLLSSLILILLCLGFSSISTEAKRPAAVPVETEESPGKGAEAAAGQAPPAEPSQLNAPASPAEFQRFIASAYSVNGRTFSGVLVNSGIVAADPTVLPIGSIIEIQAGRYSGLYSVLDTGSAIKGKRIDIYMPNSREARRFGRRAVKIRVIRRGWTPGLAQQAVLNGAG